MTNTGEVKDDRKFAKVFLKTSGSHVEKVVEVLRFPHFLADKIFFDIEDILFFQKKLYKALNVPLSRMSDEITSGFFGRHQRLQGTR